mmetsp:Transcript_32425/g.89648  ORF Transcript_32425/g.89648 Transcript_32425/m.89648 type:complete len:248 (-) Transcript_32425:67-810(-)
MGGCGIQRRGRRTVSGRSTAIPRCECSRGRRAPRTGLGWLGAEPLGSRRLCRAKWSCGPALPRGVAAGPPTKQEGAPHPARAELAHPTAGFLDPRGRCRRIRHPARERFRRSGLAQAPPCQTTAPRVVACSARRGRRAWRQGRRRGSPCRRLDRGRVAEPCQFLRGRAVVWQRGVATLERLRQQGHRECSRRRRCGGRHSAYCWSTGGTRQDRRGRGDCAKACGAVACIQVSRPPFSRSERAEPRRR